MSDLVIRDVPDDLLAAHDLLSTRLGLSCTEYIRRRLEQDARAARITVSTSDWHRFADTYPDLEDVSVIGRAWK